MKVLDIFSGIGGMTLGLGFKPESYCESDIWCRSILEKRMNDGVLPKAPIHHDVKKFDYEESVDLIYAGFPCQDLSLRGKGFGIYGSRSGLFFEIMRIAKNTNFPDLFLENVVNIKNKGLKEILFTLWQEGYEAKWMIYGAAHVGAPYYRKRWWLYASQRPIVMENLSVSSLSLNGAVKGGVYFVSSSIKTPKLIDPWPTPHANCYTGAGHHGQGGMNLQTAVKVRTPDQDGELTPGFVEWLMGYPRGWTDDSLGYVDFDWQKKAVTNGIWHSEWPGQRRRNHVKGRVSRLRALGNAVVPLQAKKAYEILTEG